MILITHDLGVVAETSDQVAVVYAGEIIEYSGKRDSRLSGSGLPHQRQCLSLFQPEGYMGAGRHDSGAGVGSDPGIEGEAGHVHDPDHP